MHAAVRFGHVDPTQTGTRASARVRRAVLTMLASATLFATALVAWAPAAGAATTLALDPNEGPPGTSVTATGTGFVGNESVTITFGATVVATTTSTAAGTFSVGFTLAPSTAPGSYTVVAKETPSNRLARATFRVETNWPQYGLGPQRGSFNPHENILTRTNVHTLTMQWQANVGQGSTAVAVDHGVVYAGSFQDPSTGVLYAFPVHCTTGGLTCSPIWHGDLGDRDVVSAPAVANGFVYLAAQDGDLYAFNANGCGTSACSPLWKGSIGSTADGHGPPAVANGLVYVTFDDGLYVFAAAGCGGPVCAPLWFGAGDVSSGGVAVTAKYAYVSTVSGIEVFKAKGCGAGTCLPVWKDPTPTANFQELRDSPVVNSGQVFVSSASTAGGAVYAFSAAPCGAATCAPQWVGPTTRLFNTPAVAKGVVYVSSVDDGRVDAFSAAGCGGAATCSPLWGGTTGTFFNTGPAVANGVVYQGGGGKVFEFKTVGCGAALCPSIGSQLTPSLTTGDPVISDGVLYTASEDINTTTNGLVLAYALP
jgi:hypothetical protein